jgi:hypothetical protein
MTAPDPLSAALAKKALISLAGVVAKSGTRRLIETTPIRAAIQDADRVFSGEIEGVGEALGRWMGSEDAVALLRRMEAEPSSLAIGTELVTSFLTSDFFHREETAETAARVLETFLDALNRRLLQDPNQGLLIHELREAARFEELKRSRESTGGAPREIDLAEANARWETYSTRARLFIEPSTLERVHREVVSRLYVPLLRQAAGAGTARIVFLIGEAGFGKTTILGQIHDEATSDEVAWTRLLLIGDLPPDVSASSGPKVAWVMGQVVCEAPASLPDMARALATERGRGLVLVDTLDLVLSLSFVTGLRLFLEALVSAGVSVVLTCRRPEYDRLLQPLGDWLGGVARYTDSFEVPTFNDEEIRAAVRAYFRRSVANAAPADADRFTDALLSRSISNRPFREIIKSPLLLILVCELFAPEGQLPPEDLTVHLLYGVWWDRRVRSSRRFDRGTPELHRKEQVCLAVARSLFETSTAGIRESLYAADVPRDAPQDEDALADLVSDDVLREVQTSGRIRFFHQTFLEYAIARWLTTRAGTAQQGELFARLRGAGATGPEIHWWPVARQLLTLVTLDEFEALLRRLDLTDLVTFRNVSLAASARGDTRGIEQLLPIALTSDIAFQHQLLEALVELPATHGATAVRIAFALVRSGEHKSALNAVQFAAERLARDRNSPPDLFAELLDAIRANSALRGGEVHATGFLLRSWLDATTEVRPEVLALLRQRLGSFAPATQASILELFHDARIPIEEKQALVGSLLDRELPRELHLPMIPNLVAVLPGWIGHSEGARWANWEEALHAPVPNGWGIVATAVGHFLADDPTRVHQLLEDLLYGDPRRTTRNVAGLVGAVSSAAAPTVAAYLVSLRTQVPPSRQKPLREVAEAVVIHGDEETRRGLYPWVEAITEEHPKLALPLLARLLDQVPGALEPLLDLLGALPPADQPDAIKFAIERAPAPNRNALAEAILKRGITATLPDPHPSLAGFYGALLPSRPGMAALLCSLAARDSQAAATAAARVLADAADESDRPTAAELIPLLRSRFPGVRTAALDGLRRLLKRGKPVTRDEISRVAHVLSDETNPIVAQPFCELVAFWIRVSGSAPVPLLREIGGLIPRLQAHGTLNRGITRAALGALKDVARAADTALLPELEEWTRDAFFTINAEDVIDGEWRFTELLGEVGRRDPAFLGGLVAAVRSIPVRNQKALAVAIRRVHGTSSPLLREVARQEWCSEEVRRLIAGMIGA